MRSISARNSYVGIMSGPKEQESFEGVRDEKEPVSY